MRLVIWSHVLIFAPWFDIGSSLTTVPGSGRSVIELYCEFICSLSTRIEGIGWLWSNSSSNDESWILVQYTCKSKLVSCNLESSFLLGSSMSTWDSVNPEPSLLSLPFKIGFLLVDRKQRCLTEKEQKSSCMKYRKCIICNKCNKLWCYW